VRLRAADPPRPSVHQPGAWHRGANAVSSSNGARVTGRRTSLAWSREPVPDSRISRKTIMPKPTRLHHAHGHAHARAQAAARLLVCASASLPIMAAFAQTPPGAPVTVLPAVTVTAPKSGSPTAPSLGEARRAIEATPGGVALVPANAWRETQAATLKDILDYTPGVFAQPKWGGDTRLSIRGSGLSRYYHLRGVLLYQDGVPLNSADGSGDFHAIDPSAYRYAAVYKGANGLRYGASALGGAINFVTPTGRDSERFSTRLDAGSFGWRRAQAGGGFAGDTLDGFITGSTQAQDGYREHSGGQAQRVSGNLGWRLSEHVETRFYVSGEHVRQRIPGSLTRAQALNDPREAAAVNVANDWQRNIDSARLANRTALVVGPTTYEFGGWLAQEHLMHPIFQYLDNESNDRGVYARLTRKAALAGHTNRFTLGASVANGRTDATNSVNLGGNKLARLSATRDTARNTLLYAENAVEVLPGVTLVGGAIYQKARRERVDQFNNGAPLTRSGAKSYEFFNPKLGVLWQLDARAQVFANVSRSAEPPSFGDMNFSSANDLDRLKPQRATTIEVGTRGRRDGLRWDLALYRAAVSNEFQCVSSTFNICAQTTNIDRSIHQGIEAGIDWTVLDGVFDRSTRSDRLSLNVAYTYSDFRFDHDPVWGDKRIPGIPRHYLRAESLYRNDRGFYAGPNVEWVPSAYFVDNANSTRTTPYVLLGLRAGWEQGHWSVFVEGRNLTDRQYVSSVSITDTATAASALFEPGSGRSVYVGVQWRY
jgi:iron complex outermembrane receptor protein